MKVSYSLPSVVVEAVAALAEREGRSASNMARRLLEEALSGEGVVDEREAVGDVAGSGSAPRNQGEPERASRSSSAATIGVAGGIGAPSPAPAAGHFSGPDPKPGVK